jgi:uncharacterized membrane protein YphA (DoxX/SURF4 family)
VSLSAAALPSWLDRDRRIDSRSTARRVALWTGLIFIPAGLVKFVFHHWELHAFQSFGLPWPSGLEILAGVLEIAGGIMLILRRAVVPSAILLAITMVVAILSSGIGHGDVIPSLTLAPALLIALSYLLWMAWRPVEALKRRRP